MAATLTFLGTGNFLVPGRYWNSFVVDRHVLVEPSPSSLANLRRAGIASRELDTVVISHFHPDHTFGWPFLALELLRHGRPGGEAAERPLHVVGPPGVAAFIEQMMQLGSVENVHRELHDRLDVRYLEVGAGDGNLRAGDLALRAIEVVHAPKLRCFGFVFELDGLCLGYSGDTQPCDGLDELARSAEVLVLECAELHRTPTHMDVEAVADLHRRFPDVRLLLTHLGEGVAEGGVEGAEIPDDFETIEL